MESFLYSFTLFGDRSEEASGIELTRRVDEARAALVNTISWGIRNGARILKGMRREIGDQERRVLAEAVVEHLDVSGYEVTKKPPAPLNSTPGAAGAVRPRAAGL